MKEKDLHLSQDLIKKERAKERGGREVKELLQRTCVQFLTPTRRLPSSFWDPTSSSGLCGHQTCGVQYTCKQNIPHEKEIHLL